MPLRIPSFRAAGFPGKINPISQGSGRSGARASGGGLRVPGSGGGGDDGEDGERPKSYVSVDSEWEARLDADRALVLEETLQRLEEGGVRRA